jgi:hypothetical protein
MPPIASGSGSTGAAPLSPAAPSNDPATWAVANFSPVPCVMWSAGNRVSHRIAQEYFGYHYVWCTPTFEKAAVGRYAIGAAQPASSDPATIYRRLWAATRPGSADQHDRDVAQHRSTLEGVAQRLFASGRIDQSASEEIAAYVTSAHVTDWVPLIYAIPYGPVASRIRLVPPAFRAGQSMEYIIPDLVAGEFDVIEPNV